MELDEFDISLPDIEVVVADAIGDGNEFLKDCQKKMLAGRGRS